MTKLQWDFSWSVGIDELDAQHRRLINIVNELIYLNENSECENVADEIIDLLKEYSFYHFNKEEELMTKAGYAGLEEHQKEHHAFIKKIKQIDNNYRTGKFDNNSCDIEIIRFLTDWLKNHILETDKRYSFTLMKYEFNEMMDKEILHPEI